MRCYDFIVVPETLTVRETLRLLKRVNGEASWFIVIDREGTYGAILAGVLAQMVKSELRWFGFDLNSTLDQSAVWPVRIVSSAESAPPGEIVLVMQNDRPYALFYQPDEDRGAFQDLSGMIKGVVSGTRVVDVEIALEALEASEDRRSMEATFEDLTTAALSDERGDTASFGLEYLPASRDLGDLPVDDLEITDARARYVNTWITSYVDGEPLPRWRSLARNRRYSVQLHIGPLLRQSIVVSPRPIDPDLPPIPEEGLLLRVKLFSSDFAIENDTAELHLFRTGATERLHFAVTTPEIVGLARMRAGIYYQNNLVQSILFHAWIDEEEGDRGHWAEVEYSLSEDFADIAQLEPRRVGVFVNDNPDGTHMVGVVGTQTEGALDIGRDKMGEAVTEFRAKLLGIVMDDQQKYRYRKDNSGDETQLIEDLKTLAYLGTNLYQTIFYQEEVIDLTAQLREALSATLTSVIQVARLSSDFVFPWAGIYDRRLLIDRGKNKVCLEPLKHNTPEAGFQECATCAHANDPNTICLAGFWGLRHIVEQPLSVVKDGRPTSVVQVIKTTDGKPLASINVYTGDDFKLRVAHQQWIAERIKQKGGALILSDTLTEVHRGLRSPQQLCYFYCHGGSSPSSKNPWLTVGRDERLMPPDLYGLGLDEAWRFKNVRPLVFINACHSIEFTPEALSAFLPRFATAGASGIIGTEVSVFEPLAVEFGEGLIQAFLDGEPVGPAVQRLRWQLLRKYNVLGLVYTPYCYADLCLVPA